jgi:tryptophan 2,3-dioxygenase
MSAPDVSYGSYLRLRELLSAQHPTTDRHDEMLFVILHQTMELWMKQALYEIDAAQTEVERGELVRAYKHLARVSRIQAVMTQAWDILATMTPADYLHFRHVLGSSSGFQSAQFRILEYRLGLKDDAHLKHQEQGGSEHAAMEGALNRPSLYDAALTQLGTTLGVPLPARDVRAPYQASPEVEAAWLQVYRDPETHWPLYQLAEKLLDIDDAFLTWRHKHVLTVERIIGGKRGTGGTEGVGYLQRTLARRAFPELWSLRTAL